MRKIIFAIILLLFAASAYGQTLTTNLCEAPQTTCTEQHKIGEVTTLTAEPDPGNYFAGWLSEEATCYGTGECTITYRENKAYPVQAVFAENPTETLYVYAFGKEGGRVTSVPAGIDCTIGQYCEAKFPRGSKVVLTASTGSSTGKFTWRGLGCSGTGTCATTMTKSKTLNVRFY